MAGAGSVGLEDVVMGVAAVLSRPCVECGLVTGSTCESCIASECMPGEEGEMGQTTPLCSSCEEEKGACHFCREEDWARPQEWTVEERIMKL